MSDPEVTTSPGEVTIAADIELDAPAADDNGGGTEQGPDRNGATDAAVAVVEVVAGAVTKILGAAWDAIKPTDSPPDSSDSDLP